MTDHKFTGDEIVKAFDILDKFEFFGGQRAGRELWFNKPTDIQNKDIGGFLRDLDFLKQFINRQKAEIERLESLTKRLGNDVDVKLKYIYELEEQLKTAKSEAIKEFAQRLKVESICPYTDIDLRVVSVGDIDTLVKEMTETK